MNPRTAVILAGLALVVGVVGLVIGISAKNGNTSDEDLSNQIKSELEQQVGSATSSAQEEQQTQAGELKGEITTLQNQITDLNSSVQKLQTDVTNLTSGETAQSNQLKTIQAEVDKLDTRVTNLESKP